MAYDNQLTHKSEDLSAWYNKVVLMAELADYGSAKGTMIFRPYGYAIWEQIQKYLDNEFKKADIENVYFPIFIPQSLLSKEKEHIEGFSPELAVVTIGGGQELAEPLVVRPTSETVICDTFSRWIKSYRDLPMQINQWANVVRWEKRTYLFLRTTEFLWQEGHTAHTSHEEALEVQKWAMETYRQLFEDVLAVPGFVGQKSETEKFAGADMTLTFEALMPEGKALQSCTSHDLGQNFSKSFEIAYQSKEGTLENVWQTSWGVSTRSIGGMLMVHGDDKGLRMPPRVAPIQVVILPVKADNELQEYAKEIQKTLVKADLRVKVDLRDDESLGRKINKWELKGVPLRIEIGLREKEAGVLKLVTRDKNEIFEVAITDLVTKIPEILEQIQANLLGEAREYLQNNTFEAETYEQLKQIMSTTKGFIKAYWCGGADCELKIKEETKAGTRCRVEEKVEAGKCIYCDGAASHRWYFAQAY